MTGGCRLALWLLLLLPAPLVADDTPLLALIVDDMGDRAAEGERVAALEQPVVCAFLPHTPHAEMLAEACHRADKEVMLHQPMEPKNGAAQGPSGLYLDMTRNEVEQVIRENLEAVPHVSAVNNHMGSLLTRHPGHMAWVMEVLREQGDLLFVDSRTSTYSVGEQLADEAGLPALSRDVFLDHHRDPEAIREQLHRALRHARQGGTAVAIGHPYPETVAILEEDLPELLDDYGVRLAPLETVERRRSDATH